MAKPYKFRHVNEIAGAFVLAVVTLLVAAVALMGSSQGWFVRTVRYKLDLPKEGSMGLKEGADVSVLDNVVGTVRRLDVREGKLEAEIVVKADFAQFIRKDSKAVIRRPLGFGDASVSIAHGSAEAGSFGPGEPIPVTTETATTAMVEKAVTDIQNAVTDIRKEVIPAVQQVKLTFGEYGQIAADLRRPDGNFQQALARVNTLVANVEKGEGLAGKVFADRALAEEAAKTVPKVNATIDEFHAAVQDLHKTTAALSEQSQQTIKQMQAILVDMQKTTAALPETTRSISRTAEALPGMVLQMQETLRQVQRLVEGLQRSFLVRGSIAPDETAAPIRTENIGSGGK